MAEKLEDFNLPVASVLRIIKEGLPENVTVGKDARTSLARAAAVFVLYLTSQSSQIAQKSNRKTLLGQDVTDALENLEFEELVEPLKQCLAEYKEALKKKKLKKADGGEEEEDVEEEVEDDKE